MSTADPKANLLQPIYPGWDASDVIPFQDWYSRLFTHRYLHEDPAPSKSYFGSRERRVCAFCGKGEPDVSFSKESHIIPASLANRHYFSNEECDTCNDLYGREYENELANMLAFERAVFGIRGRKGRPKLKSQNGGAYIGGAKGGRHLLIVTDADDDSVLVEVKEDKKRLILRAPVPAYRPAFALRSLMRAAWLFFDPEQRSRHDGLLSEIKGNSVEPFEFIRAHVPGASTNMVEFAAWEKKSPDSPGATLVLHLSISHTSIIWCAPDRAIGEYRPSLLPLISTHPEAPLPTLTLTRLPSVTTSTRPGPSTMEFGFNGLSHGTQGPKEALGKLAKQRTSYRTTLSLKLADQTHCIPDVFLRFAPSFDGIPEYTLAGPSFGAKVTVRQPKPPGQVEMKVRLKPWVTTLRDAQRTLAFIEAMGVPGSRLTIKLEEDPHIAIVTDGPAVPAKIDFGSTSDLIEALLVINNALGTNFRYPKQISDDAVRTVQLLGIGLSKGRVKLADSGPYPIRVNVENGRTIIDFLRTGESFSRPPGEATVELFGKKLSLGELSVGYFNPVCDEGIPDLEKRISQLGPGETTTIYVRVSHLLFIFHHWTDTNMYTQTKDDSPEGVT